MNFNKNYPIAILDTNIVMDFPNILEILKGCNIVIPYTLIDELDKLKKEKKGARDFVNNFLALSEKANLSKDGYKLENDCMLYLDIYKDNSHHKDINLDSKKEDIKFIAEAKNLKEKYNDMETVLISSDKIMKITASNFEVEVKTLEEFIIQYINENDRNAILDILYNLFEEYLKNRDRENSELMYEMIYQIDLNTNNIDGLLKLAEDEKFDYYENEIYKKIIEILAENKDIDGLFKLAEKSNYNENGIYEIAVSNKNINALSKLQSIYYEKYKEDNRKYDEDKLNTINNYKRRLNDLEKDLKDRLINDKDFYRLPKIEFYEKYQYIYKERDSINEKIRKLSRTYYKGPNLPYYKELSNTIEELSQLENKKMHILYESKDISGLYKLAKTYNNAYNGIFIILSDNNDTEGLYKLYESYQSEEILEKIFEILSENKDTDGLFKLYESYQSEEILEKIFEILSENKDINGLYNLGKNYNYALAYPTISAFLSNDKDINGLYELAQYYDYAYERIFKILSENKDTEGLFKLSESYKSEEIYNRIFGILSENKDINGLYKLYESYKSKEIYNRIFGILSENKDINGLYKLYESYKSKEIYNRIFGILVESEDLEGLFKLVGNYNYEEVYEKIYEILEKEEDKNRLYKLIKNEDVKNLLSNYNDYYDNEHIIKIHEKIFKILIDKIEELENNK